MLIVLTVHLLKIQKKHQNGLALYHGVYENKMDHVNMPKDQVSRVDYQQSKVVHQFYQSLIS
jgi:hypothetical protein